MKNVIKKIASIAMAFTLLGTGTAVTKTISPKSDNTLVASAEKTCQCKTGRKYESAVPEVFLKRRLKTNYSYNKMTGTLYLADVKARIICTNCGNLYAYKTIYSNVKVFYDSKSDAKYVLR
ncbi:hypothetical protein [Ruminococcus sp.]|uniref:hypothetical protein n=1 Tax=Ruminococcus sp. TaxID=41978 RepID=UPI0025D9A4B7|nr:hypothetical protein [Ruminococcus sp.]